jgi:3-hydroxybutyryl-CoA dehydratase
VTGILHQPWDELVVGGTTVTTGRTITEADVVGFAALSGDWHPQHADQVWAAASPFGARIAHGALVLSYALGLVGLDPDFAVALRRLREVTFKRPVFIGDTIHTELTVSRLREVDERQGLVELVMAIRTQRDETAVRATAEVLWRRGRRTANGQINREAKGVVAQ